MTLRALVVDDDEAGRYLIGAMLRGSGLTVVEAVDGVDALRKAHETQVDVVVTDILMPNMDGYQLCRAWKSDPELLGIPLIFYSATYTDPADRRFAEALGADAFLVKPLEPDELVANIEEVVRRKSEPDGTVREPTISEETEVLREYNVRLVSKLEHKIEEVNRANSDLQLALETLSDEFEVKKNLIEQLSADMMMRERTQAELRTTNDLLSAIIASAPLAIAAFDLDWRVELWNPGAERLLGWSAEEVLGKPYPPFVGNEDDFSRTYAPVTSGSAAAMRFEIVRPRKDGTSRDIRVYTAALHGADGAVRGLASLMLDMTEERRIEAAKAEFVSVVSHELRTPLTAIIGYSDLLEAADPESDPAAVRQMIERIHKHGERMCALIENLLEVSKIQSGPVPLELELTDPVALVREAADAAHLIPPHELVFAADADVPGVFVDRERVVKAVRHVLGNAVKYSPDGGTIRVQVRSGPDDTVRISVSDQGIGFDPAEAVHIFDSFTQMDMSDTRSFGGIGVGLFLARQVVEAHGGRIEVQSRPGEGSTFTIVLPQSA
jgi:PAS domain S-box-containing protein